MTEDDLETAKAYYEENEMGDYIVIPTPETFAQALAAAREEERRDMRKAFNAGYHGAKTWHEDRYTRDELFDLFIRNLPTNAPEPEGEDAQESAATKGSGQCGDCKFYRDDNGNGWPLGYGECVRHPKSTRTNDGKSCGEYVFKDAPEGESE